MRVAVVGAGGVGAYVGASLARAGHDVGLLVTARHVEPVREHGLQVTEDDGEFTARPRVVTTDAREIGPVDAVVVTVKTYQLDAVAAEIVPLLGADTLVLTLQNGVTASARLSARLGPGLVVPGLAVIIAYLLEPGHVRRLGARPGFTLGAAPLGAASEQADARVAALAQVLADAGTVQVSADIDRDLWRKFMLITSFAGVCALADATIGEVREFAPTRDLLVAAVHEVRALANARGIGLDDADVTTVLGMLESMAAPSTASMQRDLAAGHPSEL
ncbi:MAG: ketopantoate reductase family protein [Cellulomonadaceae bacterium]